MTELEKLIKEKVDLFEKTPETLASKAEKIQLKMWRELEPLISSLDVDASGNISQTQNNISKIGEIQTRLNKLLGGSEYIKAIKTFLADIDRGIEITDELARQIEESFEPNNIQKALLKIVKNNAVEALIGESMRARVSGPFIETLTTSVASRAPLRDSVKSLRTVIEGSEIVDGRLLANVKNIAATAHVVADRAYAAAVNESISVQWYVYRGGIIDSTREFCLDRNGKYFHRLEVEAWADEDWAGKIKGTNEATIFVNCGGWGPCRHSLIAVSRSRVPGDVIQRNIANGNYKPKN